MASKNVQTTETTNGNSNNQTCAVPSTSSMHRPTHTDDRKSTSILPQLTSCIPKITFRKDTTNGLRSKLQLFYTESLKSLTTWLDKDQDWLINDYHDKLKKIFSKINNKNPKRILIEGQPGLGKTTLITKIVHDWASSKSYVKKFKLTFLVPLTELRQRSITKVIADISENCGFTDTAILEDVLQRNMSETLLVIDGFDQLSKADRMPVLKLLYKQEFPEMTVVVTCRTGWFTLKKREEIELLGRRSEKNFYDKRIQVLGIRNEEMKSFLLNFVPARSAKVINEYVKQLPESISNTFQSPILLRTLALLELKAEDLKLLKTKTQLLKKFFNFFVNHNLKEKIDLFQVDLPINSVQETIKTFGELSLSNIYDLNFEHNALTTDMYNMGFLIKRKEITNSDSRSNYEAIHRTILQFSAAFSIWIDFKEKRKNLFDNILQLYTELGETSPIFPFLVGLLQNDSDEFFQQLQPYAHAFSNSNLWNLLSDYQEINCPSKLLDILVRFLSPLVNQGEDSSENFYKTPVYNDILKTGIQTGKMKQIFIDYNTPWNLPTDVVIPNLCVFLFIISDFKRIINNLKNTKCEKLLFQFDAELFFYPEELWDFWKNLPFLSTLPTKSFSLQLFHQQLRHRGDRTYKPFDHGLQNVKFDKLVTEILYDFEADIIANLLEKNQIESLQLLSTHENFENLLKLASNSSKLHSLHLWHYNKPINLVSLTKNGQKTYKSLIFQDVQVICKGQLSNENCINCLILSQRRLDGLEILNPTILQCNVYIFNQLPTSWKGYLTLKEFVVQIDNMTTPEFLQRLKQCKNLKMLQITFKNVSEFVYFREFVECLQEIALETLIINNSNPKKLIESFASSLFPIKTIVLFYHKDSMEDLILIIQILLGVLKCKYLEKLLIDCGINISFLDRLIEKLIIDYSVFSVSQLIYGSSDDDPEFHQIIYDASLYTRYCPRTVCIELNKSNL